MTTETQGTVAVVTIAVILARVVEKLGVALLHRGNGNGHKVDLKVVEAKLDAIKDDTAHIRQYCHDIKGEQTAMGGLSQLLLDRLRR